MKMPLWLNVFQRSAGGEVTGFGRKADARAARAGISGEALMAVILSGQAIERFYPWGIGILTDYLIAHLREPHNLGHPEMGVVKKRRKKLTLFRRIA